MTGTRGKKPGEPGVKIVRKALADGTIKEYRYRRGDRKRFRIVRQHGAIRFLAEQYVKSPEFKNLSTLWQSRKRYYLGILEDELDWMTIADLNRREARGEFYALRDGLAETRDKADKLIDTLKGLLAWGYERGHLDVNHALGIKHLAPSGKRRPDKIWTEDQQALYLAAADRCIQRAFLFSLYTGVRKADACARLKSDFRDGWLTFKPHKTLDTTGVVVQLPVFALTPLRDLLAEMLEAPGDYLLVATNGERLTPDNLSGHHRRIMARTRLVEVDLHWHDLRGTCVTMLSEAGCTDAEVAAITGHAIGAGSKLGDYTARTRQLALNAYQKLENWLSARPQVLAFGNSLGNRGN